MPRLLVPLIVLAAVLAAAPTAGATLVYVKRTNTASPQVWAARDDGSRPREMGAGSLPVVSPDGRWVAWLDFEHNAVRLRRTAGSAAGVRRVARSVSIGAIAFSPDSTRLAMVLRDRLAVYYLGSHQSAPLAHGDVNGFSWSPDGTSIVYGTTGRHSGFDAPSDLYAVRLGSESKVRVTRDRRSLNPLWSPTDDIVFDRQTRRPADAPAYNLFAVHPDGGAFRRITALKIPPLLDGLVPLDVSADGRRLLAEFVGQDTSVGFAVNPATGRTRSLSRNAETGFVASSLTAGGRTVLGMTGGADPSNRHDVVTLPWGGGKPTVLVRRAAYPQWSR